jgi:histidinol-phosphate aminotransferase
MTSPDAAVAWFPSVPSVWRRSPPHRGHRPGQLNLKSCELLQDGVLGWYTEQLRALSAVEVVEYPLCEAARAAVAGHFDRPADEVLLSPGTDHAIRVVCEALCAPAGRLVIADPRFDSWTYYADQFGFQLDAVPMPYRAPLGIGSLIDRLYAGGPSVLVVTQPDSITGHCYSRDEIDVLARVTAAHGSLLVLDTCYLAFAMDGEDTVTVASEHRHVLRINSFSKSFGLAGARVGALLATATITDYLRRWYSEGMITGLSLRLLVSALAEGAVFPTALAEVRAARVMLSKQLPAASPGLIARPAAGNFVTFDGEPADVDAAHRRLLAAGVRTRSLTGLTGFSGGIRIATPSLPAVHRVLATVVDTPDEKRS